MSAPEDLAWSGKLGDMRLDGLPHHNVADRQKSGKGWGTCIQIYPKICAEGMQVPVYITDNAVKRRRKVSSGIRFNLWESNASIATARDFYRLDFVREDSTSHSTRTSQLEACGANKEQSAPEAAAELWTTIFSNEQQARFGVPEQPGTRVNKPSNALAPSPPKKQRC